MYNQNCYTNKNQAKLSSRFHNPTVQTEHQCKEKKPSYCAMLKRGLEEQKTTKYVPCKAARKYKNINQQANVCHRPEVLNTNVKPLDSCQVKVDEFVQASNLNANKDQKTITNVPFKAARKYKNINQQDKVCHRPKVLNTKAKPLDTCQKKLDEFVQASNLNANLKFLKTPYEILEIEKQMVDLALTREQLKSDQLKEKVKKQHKFISSKSGFTFEEIYQVGSKLGQGGQGSVYTGSLLQLQR